MSANVGLILRRLFDILMWIKHVKSAILLHLSALSFNRFQHFYFFSPHFNLMNLRLRHWEGGREEEVSLSKAPFRIR